MKLSIVVLLMGMGLFCSTALAQKHELGMQIGAMKSTLDSNYEFSAIPFNVTADSSFALQINYGYRLVNARVAGLYLDMPLAVTPKSKFNTANAFFLRSYSSLFFTPGLKLKLLPEASISPYIVAGVGISRLSPSDNRINGNPSVGDNPQTDDAFSFGGGVDLKANKFLSIRGEVRDFRSSTPHFRTNLFEKRQHNIFVTGGIVLRF
ncbi:MAG: outer membrane beta-barrel protein [Acidobacteriota bacterium]